MAVRDIRRVCAPRSVYQDITLVPSYCLGKKKFESLTSFADDERNFFLCQDKPWTEHNSTGPLGTVFMPMG